MISKNRMKAKQINLIKYPVGLPKDSDFEFKEIQIRPLKKGEILLEPLYISVDPYMRGRMILGKSYVPPFELNKPIIGGVVAKVIDSQSDNYKEGDLIQGMLPWATLILSDGEGLHKIPHSIKPSYFLGILGMPGLTAYCGFLEICKPQKGETVVISGAAGAVGTIVGQIAKIKGCKVIGIAGSDEKTELIKTDFGFDYAINYKTDNINDKLKEYCPDGIDCYYDNVGGDITDTVIMHFNKYARMALCGQISLYNEVKAPIGPRILPAILKTSSLIKGFIVSDYADKFPEAFKQLTEWIEQGALKYEETIIDGFENIPQAFIGLFSGENRGKMVVKI